jgi:hypothetical protein
MDHFFLLGCVSSLSNSRTDLLCIGVGAPFEMLTRAAAVRVIEGMPRCRGQK